MHMLGWYSERGLYIFGPYAIELLLCHFLCHIYAILNSVYMLIVLAYYTSCWYVLLTMLQAELKKIYLTQLEKLRKTDDGTYRDALTDIPDITTHAFVVCGVRRCGKSTLLQQFVKKLNKPFFIWILTIYGCWNSPLPIMQYWMPLLRSQKAVLFFLMKYKPQRIGSCMCGKSWIKVFKRLYVYLASNAASLISPSKLKTVAGVKSHTTILDYFSYFENAYLLSLVPKFAWLQKAQSLAPKKFILPISDWYEQQGLR